MKSEFYGDKRDIVKWSAILNLATKEQLKGIVQIPISGSVPPVSPKIIGPNNRKISPKIVVDVMKFFHSQRGLKKVVGIGKVHCKATKISVYQGKGLIRNDKTERDTYFKKLGKVLRKKSENNPTLFLLDPDVGILDDAKIIHVTSTEVKCLWKKVQPGHWLGLYQHAHHDTEWLKKQKNTFKKACKKSKKFVSYHGNDPGWRDSAIFAAKKPRTTENISSGTESR